MSRSWTLPLLVLCALASTLFAQDAPKKEATDTLKNGKEYTHPSGGKFHYPAAWSVREAEEGLQLVPPGAGEDEVYMILADTANGETDPGSNAVVDYVDSQVRSLLPFVKRIGKVEAVQSGLGKGAVVTWEGKQGGETYRVRGFLTIYKDKGIALMGLGPKAKVEARDKALREIFYTFGWGQGKLDTRLVGDWSSWSYKGSNGYGRETTSKASLRADGTFSYESSSETSISATTGSMASRRGSGWGGTWVADGSTLTLNFQDGTSETFNYEFTKSSAGKTFLVTTTPNGKEKMEWSRA